MPALFHWRLLHFLDVFGFGDAQWAILLGDSLAEVDHTIGFLLDDLVVGGGVKAPAPRGNGMVCSDTPIRCQYHSREKEEEWAPVLEQNVKKSFYSSLNKQFIIYLILSDENYTVS